MPEEFSPQVDIAYLLSDLNSRVRILESKYNLLGERLLVVNQNMIEEYKKIISEIKTFETDLKELKIEILNLKETLSRVIKEMDFFARKEHLKILEKYINMWNPMDFVTEAEVTRLIKGEIDNKIQKEVSKSIKDLKKSFKNLKVGDKSRKPRKKKK